MVRWGFRVIPIRVATILLALQRSGYDIDDAVTGLLEMLADSGTESGSAVRMAIGVLRDLWLSSMLPHKLLNVTEAFLEALVHDRGPAILGRTKPEVPVALRLAPQYEKVIAGAIDDFAQRRYRGEIIP